MNLLLPHRFKKVGVYMAILGITLWVLMQRGVVHRFLTFLLGEDLYNLDVPVFYMVNVGLTSGGFFVFLMGVYCIAFSKERVEDEMIQKIRVDSFQFAALLQLPLIVCGLFSFLLPGHTNIESEIIILVLVSSLMVFWFGFIGRFNYMLHVKLK
ncbi:hypothetical protein [Rufibacter roseolus]|uniref:hypothetical protein n=1 Tax=Rufibacter roseolus TaxID=2817375 RepID=UPI001B318693|nr:hypothetical protein [Rufibacter roseolus]